MLPPDGSFLAPLKPADIDGAPNDLEKEMLLGALRFYFGPAQWWNGVKDVSEPNSLKDLDKDLRKPGQRYEKLEQQTDLPTGYFAADHVATNKVKLYAAITRDNEFRAPQYFLYEARYNLTLYVGPDFYHDPQGKLPVVNTLVLDDKHRPVESYTLRFGTEL